MAFRALHALPVGTEVTHCYVPLGWGLEERTERLTEEYGFECDCARCEVEKIQEQYDGGREEGGGADEVEDGDEVPAAKRQRVDGAEAGRKEAGGGQDGEAKELEQGAEEQDADEYEAAEQEEAEEGGDESRAPGYVMSKYSGNPHYNLISGETFDC